MASRLLWLLNPLNPAPNLSKSPRVAIEKVSDGQFKLQCPVIFLRNWDSHFHKSFNRNSTRPFRRSDGTQVDDLGDDRPGFRAAQEAGVKSPLLLASFSKAEVRETARVLGLAVWDKPAMPCLSSRINHGEEVTTDKLGMIGQAELYIKELTGVRNLRVRYSNSAARIEVAPEERKLFFDETVIDQVDRTLKGLGFMTVTLDLKGYSRKERTRLGDVLLLPMASVSE